MSQNAVDDLDGDQGHIQDRRQREGGAECGGRVAVAMTVRVTMPVGSVRVVMSLVSTVTMIVVMIVIVVRVFVLVIMRHAAKPSATHRMLVHFGCDWNVWTGSRYAECAYSIRMGRAAIEHGQTPTCGMYPSNSGIEIIGSPAQMIRAGNTLSD
jgi:hypothetical protein